jgi:hypothetical protein
LSQAPTGIHFWSRTISSEYGRRPPRTKFLFAARRRDRHLPGKDKEYEALAAKATERMEASDARRFMGA